MDTTQFWHLIDKTRAASHGDYDKQAELLVEELVALPVEETIEYQQIFDRLHHRTDQGDLSDVAAVISGGMGDSSWQDFRAWLIGQGQAVYDSVLNNPVVLGDLISNENDPNDSRDMYAEMLIYSGQIAYERKTNTEGSIPLTFEDEPLERRPSLWKEVASVEEFNNRFKEKYPQIWEKFGW